MIDQRSNHCATVIKKGNAFYFAIAIEERNGATLGRIRIHNIPFVDPLHAIGYATVVAQNSDRPMRLVITNEVMALIKE